MDRRAYINYEKCDNHPKCLAARRCLMDAFEKEDNRWVITDRCTACGACLHFCEQSCIEMRKIKSDVKN